MVIDVGESGQGRSRVGSARLRSWLLGVRMGRARMSNGVPDLPGGLYGAGQE
jgi:hypothetical protein